MMSSQTTKLTALLQAYNFETKSRSEYLSAEIVWSKKFDAIQIVSLFSSLIFSKIENFVKDERNVLYAGAKNIFKVLLLEGATKIYLIKSNLRVWNLNIWLYWTRI